MDINNRNTSRKAHQKGSALVIVAIAITILLIVGSSLLSMGLSGRKRAIRSGTNIAAQAAADAGVSRAIYEMEQLLQVEPWDDSDLPSGTENLPNSDQSFSYTVIKEEEEGVYLIQSTGTCINSQQTVLQRLILEQEEQDEQGFALFAEETIDLSNNADIDGYNLADDEILVVGTNSTSSGAVDIGNNAVVDGDVVVGAGGDPETVIDNNGTISGETFAATDVYELPEIVVPAELQALPSGGTINNDITLYSSGKYDRIDLGNNDVISIRAPISLYITGDMEFGNNAKIAIDTNFNPDASLTIYLAGDFDGGSNSALNYTGTIYYGTWTRLSIWSGYGGGDRGGWGRGRWGRGGWGRGGRGRGGRRSGTRTYYGGDVNDFILYGLDSCQEIRMGGGSTISGLIQARNADLIVGSNADIYGAALVESATFGTNGALHFDGSLTQTFGIIPGDEPTGFSFGYWEE